MEAVGADGQVDYSEPKDSKGLLSGFTNFEAGDVILAKITPCFENGKGALLNDMPTRVGFGSTEFHVLRVNIKAIPKFIYYITKSDLFMRQGEALMIGSAGQKRVSTAYVENFQLALPSLSEQRSIVGFLEEKTSLIAQAISTKERQIERLKERKQILIQQAVTRGLNPHAPMRDSGIEWLGEIPAHWEVKRVKRLFRLVIDASEKNNSHELLSVYTEIGVRPRKDLEERGNKASTTDHYWLVSKGDIVVNKLLAWMGAIGLSNFDGVTSPAYDVLRPKEALNGFYYHNLFRMSVFSAELKRQSRGIMDMRLRLYFDKFGSVEVPAPPLDEQVAIVAYIEQESVKLDKAIGFFEQQITKLKEYKSTLINSAVTGKIKVPGVVEPAELKEREFA